jgi:hypothetical protein
MRAGGQVQGLRNAVMRLFAAPAWRTSCFCSGSAPRGSPRALHSDHPVNGAIIHTQLTAAACDGQPVALGGSSLGVKMGLKVGAPTKPPLDAPHGCESQWARRDLSEMLERAAERASFEGPHHPRRPRDSLPKATC